MTFNPKAAGAGEPRAAAGCYENVPIRFQISFLRIRYPGSSYLGIVILEY